jgi:hypothetical protein
LIFEFYPHLLANVGGIEPTDLLDAVRGHGYQILSIERAGSLTPALSNEGVLEAVARSGEHDYVDLLAVPADGPPAEA